ncbi:MAG: hypothetical protein ABW054_10060 [Casimicrobiaceae bacterium]
MAIVAGVENAVPAMGAVIETMGALFFAATASNESVIARITIAARVHGAALRANNRVTVAVIERSRSGTTAATLFHPHCSPP